MDNKENELFNGIIDVPVEQPKPENIMPNNQNNLEYNFNFETQVEQNQVINNDSVVNNQMPSFENMSSVGPIGGVQMNPAESVPSFEQTQAVQPQTAAATPSIESAPVVQFTPDAQPIETVSQPETIDFNTNVSDVQPASVEMPSMIEQTPEEKKQANEELLKNLTADTNNFVNPNLIVNPSVKALEQQPELISEELSVDYKEEKKKGKYAFAIILIALIALFILFLPKIVSVLGF